MSLLDDIKAKADANDDGKISVADLEALKNGTNNDQIDKLKDKFLGKDGKLSIDDLQNFNLESIKSNAGEFLADTAKDTLDGFFNKKK